MAAIYARLFLLFLSVKLGVFLVIMGTKRGRDQRWNRWERRLEGDKDIGYITGNDGIGGIGGGIDYHFAYASFIGHIAIKADGIILFPLHSYQILSVAFFLLIIDNDHKILGDGGNSVTDAVSDFEPLIVMVGIPITIGSASACAGSYSYC